MSVLRRHLAALPLAGLGLWAPALAGAQGAFATPPASTLKACATIDASTERLACYDQLAGRAQASVNAPLSGAGTQAPPAVSAPPPAPAPKESFGLHAAEHPAVPLAAALTARVVGLGVSANGHPTVALEGGQLWELDDADPLLANGDSVTISRAALGSFLMTTPGRRTHRVHRLR